MTTFTLNTQAAAAAARVELIAAASGEGTISAIAAAVVVRRNESAGLAKGTLKALAEVMAETTDGRCKAKTLQNYLSLAAQVASHQTYAALAVDATAKALAAEFKAA